MIDIENGTYGIWVVVTVDGVKENIFLPESDIRELIDKLPQALENFEKRG